MNEDKRNNIYNFNPNQNKKTNHYYYEWNSKLDSDDMIAEVTVSVSDSFLDRVETALARLDLTLDNLLDYLHAKKSS